jgi:hypothetical protein
MKRFESHSTFNALLESQRSDEQHYHLMDDAGAETTVDSNGGERGNNELAVFSDSSSDERERGNSRGRRSMHVVVQPSSALVYTLKLIRQFP